MTDKASSLLMRVYQAQNNSQKTNELKGFMNQSRLPAQNIQQNTQDIQQNAPALLLNEKGTGLAVKRVLILIGKHKPAILFRGVWCAKTGVYPTTHL